MRRLVFPFPFWILVAIIVGVCSAMTKCRYDGVTAWQGNCSPKEVTTATDGKAALWLSCPGFAYSAPFTRSGYMVSLMAKRTLPQSFWCKVTRSGYASCVLPETSGGEVNGLL